MSELRKCPFCGGKPKITQRQDSLDGYFCAISCFCGGHSARAHQFATDKGNADVAYREAKNLWNRRADIGITTTGNEPPRCYLPDGDGCAYQTYSENNDEPIDKCKECPHCYSDKERHMSNVPLTLDEPAAEQSEWKQKMLDKFSKVR